MVRVSEAVGLSDSVRGGALHWLVKTMLSLYTAVVAVTRFMPETSAHGVITGVFMSAPWAWVATPAEWVEETVIPVVAGSSAIVLVVCAAVVAIFALYSGAEWVKHLPHGELRPLPDVAIFMWGVFALLLDLNSIYAERAAWLSIEAVVWVTLFSAISVYRGYRSLPLARVLPARRLIGQVVVESLMGALTSILASIVYPVWAPFEWARSGGKRRDEEPGSLDRAT